MEEFKKEMDLYLINNLHTSFEDADASQLYKAVATIINNRLGAKRLAYNKKRSEIERRYQGRKKRRLAGGRQLDAAREEYARLLNVMSEAKSRAEDAAERMYRAEKISVRDVIETDVKDPDFLYLNRYGALLAKAQADEQAALGELRRAQKKSDTV